MKEYVFREFVQLEPAMIRVQERNTETAAVVTIPLMR